MPGTYSYDIFFLKSIERKLSGMMPDKNKNENIDSLDINKNTDAVFDLYNDIFSDIKGTYEICKNGKNEFSMKKLKHNIERLENINNYIKDQLEKYYVSDTEKMTLDENTYRIRFGYPYGENGLSDREFCRNMESMLRIGKNLIEYGRNAVKNKNVGEIVNFEYSIVFLQLDFYNVFGVYFK